MNALSLAVLAFTVLLDVAGQLCFKLGLEGPQAARSRKPVWLKVATTPLIWAGVLAYAVDLAAWLFVLSRLPLSVAFPLASISYCAIALAGRFILNEPVSRQRWIGTILIALGVAIVSTTT
jgi:drug/metabolite transporter (DMT)-like permease